jgi:hypothetical protein
VAINRGHDRVLEVDLQKAEETYSEDMLLNTAFELRDTHPDLLNVLYAFNRAPNRLRVTTLLAESKSAVTADTMIGLLVWFGVLGVQEFGQDEPVFAYHVRYNVEKLLVLIYRGRAMFVIHPAFYKALTTTERS